MGRETMGWDGTVADTGGIELIGRSDLNGHGDVMHINVAGGVAYVGHMGESRIGTTVLDVSDPTSPEVAHQIETPIGTHSHKVQVVDDLLLVNHEQNHREPRATSWSAGLKTYDISDPLYPKEVGFLEMPGRGVHRMTYWEAPYAYMSGSDEGFTDQFLVIADVSDASNPVEVGRWWFPGMNVGAGETPSWDPDNTEVKLHHPVIRDNLAYCGWWDLGLVILDVSDVEKPELVSHLDFGSETSTCTHSAVPIPGRDILVVTDEAHDEYRQNVPRDVRVVDVSDPSNPAVVSKFPIPEGDFSTRGGRFGPHNIHEMRPGSLVDSDRIFVAYFNAGLRVYNISDPENPVEEAHYVPETPTGQPSAQLNDLVVDSDGLIYIGDRYNGGLYILRLTD